MFSRAVHKHQSSQPAKDSAALPTPPSTVSANHAPPLHQMTLNKTNPLQSSRPSLINAKTQPVPINKSSVKRTSSGFAKSFHHQNATDGFSDSASTSAQSTMPTKMIKTVHETITIDEDDFDSDPELDPTIQKPSAYNTVAYPTLPPSPAKVSYPPLHRKAEMHTHAASLSHNTPAEPPPSSMPIPWSSSPPEHKMTPPARKPLFQPMPQSSRPTPATSTITTAHDVLKHSSASNVEPSSGSSPIPPPAKRRALPWMKTAEESKAAIVKDDEKNKKQTSIKTPGAKSSSTVYPWNLTASAIKTQQREMKKFKGGTIVKNEDDADVAIHGLKKPSKSKVVPRLMLSSEQRHVMELVVDNHKSVFFTGSAGTGKSVLLREIIAALRQKYKKELDRVAVTASTGLAACNIGGVTLHSFAGIGLGKEDVPELVKKIKRNQKAKQRWMRTKILVIDEVSMVDGELFDKLEQIARTIRNNGRPFGGIQVVITGDFFQLPPVPEGGRAARFCFDAGTWTSAIDHTIGLHHVFRQKDPEFARMLNEMREGRLSQTSISAFRALSREPKYEDDLQTTELFPTRAEVDAANSARMRNLYGNTMTFEAKDGGTIQDKTQRDRLLANCMAPATLELKKGSQVMLIKNMDEMLVNGSLGTVRGFMSEALFNEYEPSPEEFDYISNAAPEELDASQLKKKRAMHLSAGTSQLFPLVRFQNADGTTRDFLCNRESWKIELPNGEIQASRLQVPLILAWALSIHKAQGQTLDRVKVDLGKVFERGQAYVALSRATTMQGLQVLRFDPKKVQAHERVRSFYASLSRAEETHGVDHD